VIGRGPRRFVFSTCAVIVILLLLLSLYYMDRCDGLCRLASVAEKVSQSQKRSQPERFDGRWNLPIP